MSYTDLPQDNYNLREDERNFSFSTEIQDDQKFEPKE